VRTCMTLDVEAGGGDVWGGGKASGDGKLSVSRLGAIAVARPAPQVWQVGGVSRRSVRGGCGDRRCWGRGCGRVAHRGTLCDVCRGHFIPWTASCKLNASGAELPMHEP